VFSSSNLLHPAFVDAWLGELLIRAERLVLPLESVTWSTTDAALIARGIGHDRGCRPSGDRHIFELLVGPAKAEHDVRFLCGFYGFHVDPPSSYVVPRCRVWPLLTARRRHAPALVSCTAISVGMLLGPL
jgi:hypothetical protein